MFTFSGKVTDATTHEGLQLVAVALMAGSTVITGVNTNADGTFTFTVQNADAVTGLQFSYIGYQSQTIAKQSAPYIVALQPIGVNGPTATITATKYPTLKVALGILAILATIYLINKYA